MIDAAFLKSKFKGQLVIATASDAEHHIFVLAYGIIDVECNDSWIWFLEKLKHIYGDHVGMVFVTDRHHAIAHAINFVYDYATHLNCYYHLKGNLTSMFPRGNWTNLFYDAAYACGEAKFRTNFSAMGAACTTLNKKGKTICQYLTEDIRIEKWARSYAPQRRYEMMTSNHAESFNSALRRAREAPPITLLDEVLNTVSGWFTRHREFAKTINTTLVPTIDKLLMNNYRNAQYVTATFNDEYTYDCKSQLYGDHIVNLHPTGRSCTCGEFQQFDYPCVHACAAIVNGKECIRQTNWTYLTQTFKNVYEDLVLRVPNRTQWSGHDIPDAVRNRVCLPPPYLPKRGRQQKIRHPSQGETVMNIKRRYRCTNCKEGHHSKKYCPKLGMGQWFESNHS